MTNTPIERYLDDLQTRLWLPPSDIRRVVAETEDHLREAVGRHVSAGLAVEDAERRAITDFGTPRAVAARFAAEVGRTAPPSLLIELLVAAMMLGSIGLVAIGLSGLVAEAMGRAFGPLFVAADGIGVTYTPERCADFIRLVPGAADCASAAIEHHYGEIVESRLTAGVLGLLGAGMAFLLRRSYRSRAGVGLLPVGLEAGVGMAAFGGATALCLGLGLMESVFYVPGAGGLLSGGVVSLVALLVYTRLFARDLHIA